MKRSVGMAVLVACSLVLAATGACSPAAKGNLAAGEETKQEKPKKKSQSKGREPSRSETTREVLSRVLRNYKQGLESLSPSAAGKQIDTEKFYDYPRFEENLTRFLESLGELRLFVREVNVQVEEDRAVMIVDAEMKFAARDNPDDHQQHPPHSPHRLLLRRRAPAAVAHCTLRLARDSRRFPFLSRATTRTVQRPLAVISLAGTAASTPSCTGAGCGAPIGFQRSGLSPCPSSTT